MTKGEIFQAVQEIPGWMLPEKFDAFWDFYSNNPKGIAVEIGAYYGRSVIAQELIIK